MGHDITAYLGRTTQVDPSAVASRDELAEEIAYLRGDYGIYEALDAQFYDGKVSGIGIGRWFDRHQLQVAERRLEARHERLQKEGFSAAPALQFIRDCLEKLPPDRALLYIDFG